MTVVAQLDHSQNPAIVQTVVDYGEDEVPQEIQEAMQNHPPDWMDVTSVSTRPGPQWTFDGTNFAQPPEQVNQATIANNVHAAVNQNLAFLGLQTPTAAQQLGQLRALTRQMNALARLATSQFDATT